MSNDADGHEDVTHRTAGDGRESSKSPAVVPKFLLVGANWGWRFLVVAAAFGVVVWLIIQLLAIFIPIFIALTLSAFLAPLVDLADRFMPRLAATWLVVLIVAGAIAGLFFALSDPLMDSYVQLTDEWDRALGDIRSWLRDGPLELTSDQVMSFEERIRDAVDSAATGFFDRPSEAARRAAEVIGGFFLALVLTFFFIKDGQQMWKWGLERLQPVRRDAIDVGGRAAFTSLQGWLRGTAITGAVDSVIIGLALFVLDVPAALPLAVITFFAAFFPVIGATVAGLLATGVALGANGVTSALIVAGIVLAVQQVEGDILLPLVMYRQVALHPVVILLALAAGAAIGGILGALFAVPLTAATVAFIAAVNSDEPDAEPAEPDEPELV